MKAIDFACRLLLRLEENALTPEKQRILIALGAGLDCNADIAAHVALSTRTTAALLTAMTRSGLIKKSKTSHYTLSAQGSELLREFFSFLPRGNSSL